MADLLYVCEVDAGGLMEYALLQSEALADQGVRVSFLCKPTFPVERVSGRVKIIRFKPQRIPDWVRGKGKAVWLMTFGLLEHARQIEGLVKANHFNAVLFSFYKEYFSPFWVGPLKRIQRSGHVTGIIAHDPVRDFSIGPMWWHRWCIRAGYSYIQHVFVHGDSKIDFGGRQPKGLKVHEIPHGPYPLKSPLLGRKEMRNRLNLTDEQVVFLSFGQIRDGKNLDMFIRNMRHLPAQVVLYVVGKGDSRSSMLPEHYRSLAQKTGVDSRCLWDIRRVPDSEVADAFEACDIVLLTYSGKFRSASGVLNLAVSARKPVLASSGCGPLRDSVEKHGLGIFVEPDDERALLEGARAVLDVFNGIRFENSKNREGDSLEGNRGDRNSEHGLPIGKSIDWEGYRAENSWERNAVIVKQALQLFQRIG